MQKILTLLSLLLIQITLLNAQINVGSSRMTNLKAGVIKPEHLNALRNAETLFVLRSQDESEIEKWQAVLDDVWTINKITAIKRDDLAHYINKANKVSYAFLGLEGHAKIVDMQSTSFTIAHYYLHLSMTGDEIPYSKKELKKFETKGQTPEPQFETLTFARIELYPDGKLVKLADQFRNNYTLSENKTNEHMEYVYKEAKFYNWELGFLKNALQEVNRMLKNGETRWLFSEISNNYQLKKVRKETLYVPDYMLIKFNKFNGNEDKRVKEDKLFGAYKHPYELIDASKLSAKILEAKKPFYYFNYIRSNTDAFYTVTNALTGEIIYSEYDPGSYNIGSKNIKNINKAIKNAR